MRGGLTTVSRGGARSTHTSARKTSFRHRGWEQRTSDPLSSSSRWDPGSK